MKRGGSGGDDGGSGEIIQVQGGQVVRAAVRKDRHSKVYTSKGPRDRRVRLSAHTAIQFYDVQDRLGYDRPSKAVDWLITKARTAIENLAELPNHPATAVAPPGSDTTSNPGSSEPSNTVYHQPSQQSIADTMRSFFPVSPEDSSSSLMSMQGFGDGRMSRQQAPLSIGDLGLSLHSLQNQNMNQNHQMLFSGSNNGEMFQSNWNTNEGEGVNSRVGFIFNPHSVPQQLYLSQNSSISSSAFSQREPLQSNGYSNLLNHHAWNNANQQAPHQPFNQSAFYNLHFGSDFQIPARIRGDGNHGGGDMGNKHD